jgi:hypothetical protein
LQNPSQINGDNMQNLRREISRVFGKKETEYPKEKISELKTNNQTYKPVFPRF